MTALVALGLPAVAEAHGSTAVNALDFQARITSVAGTASGVGAAVIDGDRKLELHVSGSHTVVVLGYAGEPFLRFSPGGVAVNDRSTTAIAGKLAPAGSDPALDPSARPRWSLLDVTERYAWHDHRLGPGPGRVYGKGAVAAWTIPVVVDGRPARIAGRLWHQPGPARWPWLALLALTTCAALVLPRLKRLSAARIAMACAAIAGAAAVVLSIGLSFGPGIPASTAWVDVPTSAAIAAVAIALFARIQEAREALAGLTGLIATLVGLGDASVLVHGYVISSLPATCIRAAAATAICAGLVAALTVAVRLLTADRLTPMARSAMATPRGKARS